MNDRPREALQKLMQRYGSELSEEPRRCEALLRDLCPNYGRETFALVQAAQSGVPSELRNGSRHEPIESLLNRLAKRLNQNLGLSYRVSLWAVESWALALQIASPADLRMVCLCPNCEVSIVARKNSMGKRVKCPKCQAGFTVGGEKPGGAVLQQPAQIATLIAQPPPASSTTPVSQAATVVVPQAVEYFVLVDSQRHGPYSLAQLLSYPMPPGVLIWRQGLADWTAETDIPELAQHAAHSFTNLAQPLPSASVAAPPPTFGSPSCEPSIHQVGSMPIQPTPVENSWPVVVSTNSSGRVTNRYCRPHRGLLILVLGIFSLVCFSPLGIVAVILGGQDLAAMHRGKIDRSGETMTLIGLVLGIISLSIIAVIKMIAAIE